MKGRQKGMNPCGTQKETDTATSHSPLSRHLLLSLPAAFFHLALHTALYLLWLFIKNVSQHPFPFLFPTIPPSTGFLLFFHHHICMTDKCAPDSQPAKFEEPSISFLLFLAARWYWCYLKTHVLKENSLQKRTSCLVWRKQTVFFILKT